MFKFFMLHTYSNFHVFISNDDKIEGMTRGKKMAKAAFCKCFSFDISSMIATIDNELVTSFENEK